MALKEKRIETDASAQSVLTNDTKICCNCDSEVNKLKCSI